MQVVLLNNKSSDCCITCNSKSMEYGDDKHGYIFCKDCFDMYSCLHCKKMNISLYG
jgi:hypothetical protein